MPILWTRTMIKKSLSKSCSARYCTGLYPNFVESKSNLFLPIHTSYSPSRVQIDNGLWFIYDAQQRLLHPAIFTVHAFRLSRFDHPQQLTRSVSDGCSRKTDYAKTDTNRMPILLCFVDALLLLPTAGLCSRLLSVPSSVEANQTWKKTCTGTATCINKQ